MAQTIESRPRGRPGPGIVCLAANILVTPPPENIKPEFQTRAPSPSAAVAAEIAMSRWVRVAANMSLGAYETYAAIGDLQDPMWPQMPFQEILKVAFKDHVVESLDHPLVRRLRGAA